MEKTMDRLINIFRVSSNEKLIREEIKKELINIKAEINEDKLGNLILKVPATSKTSGKDSNKIMITCPIDAKGLIITFIEDKGFIRAGKVGNIEIKDIINRQVITKSGVTGVVRCNSDKPSIKDIYVDFGFKSKKEAESMLVKEGECLQFKGDTIQLCNDKFSGTGIGEALLIKVLFDVIKENVNSSKECYFVFAAQGQLAGRGARAAAYETEPDYCLVLSTENSGDYPEGKESVALEGGPVLVLRDGNLIICKELEDKIESLAKEHDINIQRYVGKSNTAGGPIHKELGGINTGVISLPVRYKGTHMEMVSLKDIEALKKLIISLIK